MEKIGWLTVVIWWVIGSFGYSEIPWPKDRWPTATPESQGLSTTILDQAHSKEKSRSDSILVIRNGYHIWSYGCNYCAMEEIFLDITGQTSWDYINQVLQPVLDGAWRAQPRTDYCDNMEDGLALRMRGSVAQLARWGYLRNSWIRWRMRSSLPVNSSELANAVMRPALEPVWLIRTIEYISNYTAHDE